MLQPFPFLRKYLRVLVALAAMWKIIKSLPRGIGDLSPVPTQTDIKYEISLLRPSLWGGGKGRFSSTGMYTSFVSACSYWNKMIQW
jgi:hypothetical protein